MNLLKEKQDSPISLQDFEELNKLKVGHINAAKGEEFVSFFHLNYHSTNRSGRDN